MLPLDPRLATVWKHVPAFSDLRERAARGAAVSDDLPTEKVLKKVTVDGMLGSTKTQKTVVRIDAERAPAEVKAHEEQEIPSGAAGDTSSIWPARPSQHNLSDGSCSAVIFKDRGACRC